MKALCFLIPLLLYITKFICSHHLNVGTVLFTKPHLRKTCWTDSEMMLLTSRQLMQGVLPDPDYIDITKTGTITVLLEYFQTCFEVIRQTTTRKAQRIMYLALADALGGYLRSYILPLTRQAHYAGQVKYFEAKKVYQFYEEIKDFLRTNGAGWAKPRLYTLNCIITPLRISLKGCDTACSKLFLRDEAQMEVCRKVPGLPTELPMCPSIPCGMHENRRLFDIIEMMRNKENVHACGDNNVPMKIDLNGRNMRKIQGIRKSSRRCKENVRSPVTSATNTTNSTNNTNKGETNDDSRIINNSSVKFLRKRRGFCGRKQQERQRCRNKLIVPLPVLDDPANPKAIGLPFKVRPIRSLCSPPAISILVRYYVTVIKCIVAKTNNKCDLCNFNAQFQSWLSCNIFPHLEDEEWYPAFGGVLKIEETIKTFGSDTSISCKSSCTDDIGYVFSKGYGFDELDYSGNEVAECSPSPRKENKGYLIIGIMLIVTLWIMALCYCICCHCAATKTEDEAQETQPQTGQSGTEPKSKKKANTSNSFNVQCLVKFFKRSEEKKDLAPIKENINTTASYKSTPGEPEPAENQEMNGTVINDEPSSVSREDVKQKRLKNMGTIVLPAQINPLAKEIDFNSFWPLTEYRNDDETIAKPYPEEPLKCFYDLKEAETKISRRGKEQFRTLWKRQKSVLRSSESYACISAEIARSVRERSKRKADVLSRSSCSESGGSAGSRRRVVFMRRSRSAFDCQGSCRCSFTSSSASYSSSQPEDDLPVELFGQFMACQNSFSQKPHKEELQKPKIESESERGLTSSNSSEESTSSVKRIP